MVEGIGPAASTEFRQTVGFGVWASTIGVQTAYWAVVVGPVWRDLAQTWRRAEVGRTVRWPGAAHPAGRPDVG